MKKFKKIVVGILVASVLLQPLGLVTPVFAAEVRMEYSDPEHIHAPKVVNGVNYKYDANGNLVNDGERTIEWNQDNLPTKIEKDGKVIEFFYDANGRRILKRSGQDKVVYVSSSYEQSTINNEQSTIKFYFANGRAAVRNTPSGGESTLTYLHQDHLGSTVLATDSNSQPTSDSLSYFPYGSSTNNLTIQQFNNSSYLFTGQELDPESDLYNYLARLYNPKTGAFISADSLGSGNRYAYAANNPLLFTDPTGHQPAYDPGVGGGGGRSPDDVLQYEISGGSIAQPCIMATEPMGGETLQSPLEPPLPPTRLEKLFYDAVEDLFPDFVRLGVDIGTLYLLTRMSHYIFFVKDMSPADAQLIANEFMAATGKVVELHFEMPGGASSVAAGMHELKEGVHRIYLGKLKEYVLQHELGHAYWENLSYVLKDYWVNMSKVRQSEMAADKYAYELLKEAGNTWGARLAYSRYLFHKFWGVALEAWAITPPPTLPPVPIYIDFGWGYCPPGGEYPCGGNTGPVSN